ncbi:MAG: GntR family transcriptional regulator [Burkholderiaceae bacterium]
MPFHLDRNAPIPLHEQIKEQIVGMIHAGQLKAGDQLPTMRALSVELKLNVNTVAHAYRELDAAGLIVTRRGEGTFVANTAGEAEMALVRQHKLQSLVNRLFVDAHRLGYAPEELEQAIALHHAAGQPEH